MKLFIVENDEGFGARWVDILRDLGHEVEWCQDLAGASTSQVHQAGYDLALIDRRAEDDNDPDDVSGQNFAIQLSRLGTPAVLVTAFLPPPSQVFDLIRAGEIAGAMDKQLPTNELVACVEQYAFSRRFPNGFANFGQAADEGASSLRLWQLIRDRLGGLSGWTPPDFEEFTALFRSLMSPSAVQVVLQPISGGQSKAALVRASVSLGDGLLSEEFAIKYGERTTIRSEEMRYDRFVGPLPYGVAPQIRWRSETETLGALAYSWLSDSLEEAVPFGALYSKDWPHLTWQRRRNAISRLFGDMLNSWYEVYRSGSARLEQPESLLAHYTGKGGAWYDEIDLNHLELRPHELSTELPFVSANGMWNFGEYGESVNPVQWVMEGVGSQLQFDLQSPVHGDLNVANIYVLPDDSPRLMDFGRTGLGHIYRDFAALETSIRLMCVEDEDPRVLKEAEDQICEAKHLEEYIDYRSLGGSGDLKEAVQTTMQIRRAALDATAGHGTDESMQEYLFAVVIHMLRYATGAADEVSEETDQRKDIRIWHALYGAARAAKAANDIISVVKSDKDWPRE